MKYGKGFGICKRNYLRHVLRFEENEIKCIKLNKSIHNFSYVTVDTSLLILMYFKILPECLCYL